jgi:hypothetical protein
MKMSEFRPQIKLQKIGNSIRGRRLDFYRLINLTTQNLMLQASRKIVWQFFTMFTAMASNFTMWLAITGRISFAKTILRH